MVQGPRLPLGSQYKGLPSSLRENRTKTMGLLRTLSPDARTHWAFEFQPLKPQRAPKCVLRPFASWGPDGTISL